MSAISIASPLIALRLPMGQATATTDGDADKVASVSILIAFALSLSAGAAIALAKFLNILPEEFAGIGSLVYALPVALFFVALQEVADIRIARLGFFRVLSIAVVLQAIIVNGGRVIGGIWLDGDYLVLILACVSAPLLQFIMLSYGGAKRATVNLSLPWQEVKRVLAIHRDFPLYRAPTDLIGAFSQSVPVFMLASLFSPTISGFYVLARSVINLPLNVIGSAVGNVYYGRYAELQRHGKNLQPGVMKATLLHLGLLGVPIILIAPLFPRVFALVFGGQWEEAGEYAMYMALWIAGMLTNIPSVRALPVIGKQSVHFVFSCILSAGGVVAILAGEAHSGGDPKTVVYCYSIVLASIYTIQIFVYNWLIVEYDKSAR